MRKDKVPPGLEKHGGRPPGLGRKDKVPPGHDPGRAPYDDDDDDEGTADAGDAIPGAPEPPTAPEPPPSGPDPRAGV